MDAADASIPNPGNPRRNPKRKSRECEKENKPPQKETRTTRTKLSHKQLREMGFDSVCRHLGKFYISCHGLGSVDELIERHDDEWGTDKSHLPLYQEREEQKQMAIPTCAPLTIGLAHCTAQVRSA
eukprot:552625-Rhodomonas_salina.1